MLCHTVTRTWLLPPFFLLCMAAPYAGAAMLSVTVTYEEVGGTDDAVGGSPVGDLFTIENNSEVGDLTALVIALDSGLLFDTDYLTDIAGTSPSFPFVSSTIDPVLIGGSVVPDGSNAMAFTFVNFGPGKSYSFQIDVDRTGQATDGENRQVLGGDFDGIFSVVFVGSFPESPLLNSQEFVGDGDTAGGTVEMFVSPEPDGLTLASAALAIMIAVGASRPRLAARRLPSRPLLE